MLNLFIALTTFGFSIIVAYGRYDLLPTYYLIGTIYALFVGGLLGSRIELRDRPYRLHLWIAGICVCFIVMWLAAGTTSFSGTDLANASALEVAKVMAPRVLLLYLGIYLASRASDGMTEMIKKLWMNLQGWTGTFMTTPITKFKETNRKMRAVLMFALTASGVWAVVTGDLPTAMSIAKDLLGLVDLTK